MAPKIVIIGAGPGGYTAAVRAAQLGAQVTIVEKEHVGGTCLNWGCIPSKIMITTADLFARFQQAKQFGIDVEGPVRTDMNKLMARKEAVLVSQRKGIANLLRHHKINHVIGAAAIAGHGKLVVSQPEQDDQELSWDKLIIATGTRPFEIPKFPFDGQRVLSSDHALSLTHVPQSILIVGGGVIGCEFAGILSGLGSQVTIVEALDRLLPLPSVDADCSRVLQREMKKRKIKLILNRGVDACAPDGDRLAVTIGPSPFVQAPSPKDNKPTTLTVDQMLICIGRAPNTAGIGLDTIDLKTDARGWIEADSRMQTAAPDVYAIGDVLGPAKIMLAHVASTEGRIAAENAMGGSREMDYHVVPGAIFTHPEVGNVGLSEDQARAQGLNVRADSVLFRALGKAQVIGEIAGQAKIVSEIKSGKILGAHIVGPHATDLIAEAVLAMHMGGTVRDIAGAIHAHPTLSEIMLETSFKAMDMALHG